MSEYLKQSHKNLSIVYIREQRNDRWRTAIHEAGHALATIVLGKRIKYVTIEPDEKKNILGYCAAPMFRAGPHSNERKELNAMIFYAGREAEVVVCRSAGIGGHLDRPDGDYYRARRLIRRAKLPGTIRNNEMRLRKKVICLLDQRVLYLCGIAQALIMRTTLTMAEVRVEIRKVDKLINYFELTHAEYLEVVEKAYKNSGEMMARTLAEYEEVERTAGARLMTDLKNAMYTKQRQRRFAEKSNDEVVNA